MNTAAYYAKALFDLVSGHPERGKEYLTNLKKSLESRGHQKLLPRIFDEYQKLLLRQERLAKHKEVTPRMRQTQALLQLYRRLISH